MSARLRLQNTIEDMRSWMLSSKLKLNESKTELLIITSKSQHHLIEDRTIQVGDSQIKAVSSVRNLGVVFDENMCMDAHVKKICRSVYYSIHNVNSIRKVLDHKSAAMLIHSFVLSRLDIGNALLFNITSRNLNKLQYAQNSAARVLTGTSKYQHISPVLKKLHWLPIRKRIEFKILLLTWKALNGMAPKYLQDLVMPYTPARSLRSSHQHLLKTPKTRVACGERAFSAAAPSLWNNLPLNLRIISSLETFKSKLKSHLFL